MTCFKCKSERTVSVFGKCSDLCHIQFRNIDHTGYVPRDMNIGGGDSIDFEYCLDCGQIQDSFPLEKCELEIKEDNEKEEIREDICNEHCMNPMHNHHD